MRDDVVTAIRRLQRQLLGSADPMMSGVAGSLPRQLRSILHNVDAIIGDGAWTPDATREALRTISASQLGPDGADDRLARMGALSVKAASLAHAVATGRWDHVPSHERRACEARLAAVTGGTSQGTLHLPGVHAPSTTDPPSSRGTVTFRFPVPARRPGARTSRVLAPVEGATTLTVVDAADAPVVARLATPGGDWLDVRDVDGVTHRPVLSPGSWRPIAASAFRRACVEAPAWRDSPFLVRAHQDAPAFALDDVADPALAARAAASPEAGVEALACAARAGSLVVIDGVVYRAAPEPTLQIVGLVHGPESPQVRAIRFAVAWRMGDLWSTDDQETSGLAYFDERPTRNLWIAPETADARHVPPAWASVGIGDGGALAQVVRELDRGTAGHLGREVRDDAHVFAVREVALGRFPARSEAINHMSEAFARNDQVTARMGAIMADLPMARLYADALRRAALAVAHQDDDDLLTFSP